MSLLPKLQPHNLVPFWILYDKYGQEYNLAKQRGRDHLMLLIVQPGADAQSFLHDLVSHAAAWRQLPARGIVVVPDADTAGALGALPFLILIDETGKVRHRFLPDEAQAGIFVLDRYGELYHQWLVIRVSDLPPGSDITDWLEAISMQCNI